MEIKVALINKTTKRIENIIIVDSAKDSSKWATDTLDAVAVGSKQTAYLHGTYQDGEFTEPDNDYLISIGLLQPPKESQEDQ